MHNFFHSFEHIFVHAIKHTLMITVFVLVMMMVIEYITIRTRGKWRSILSKNSWFQIIFAAFLGIIPGCLGSFIAVSLYTHKMISFAAIVTTMIATSGDEAFIMFAEIPETALIITGSILGIAIITGFILNFFLKKKTLVNLKVNHLKHHDDEKVCFCFNGKIFLKQMKQISFQRLLMLLGIGLFLLFLLLGEIGPKEWGWEKISFVIVSIIGLLIILTVPDHFITEHLWKHTIKKHLLKIFLWTFGTLLLVHIALHFLDISEENFMQYAKQFYFLILIIAVLVGIIPESGPHLVFVFLFASGVIPLSILLANSIVQDGHGSIPLLAESKKSFFVMKGINIIVGLLVGVLGFLFNF